MTRERGTGVPSASEWADPSFYEALGRAIKVARTQQDMSRRALAERAGVSYAYLSDIETGRGRPSSKALLAVAGALGRTPSELLQQAELYGALHDVATSPRTDPSTALSIDVPEERRWFHSSPSASAYAAALAPPSEPPRSFAPGRAQPRPRMRGGSADRAAAVREELQSLVDDLSDDDAEIVLQLARRLRAPRR